QLRMNTNIVVIVNSANRTRRCFRNQVNGLKAIVGPRFRAASPAPAPPAGLDTPRKGIVWVNGGFAQNTSDVQNRNCSESHHLNNRNQENSQVPPRKKQPTDAGASRATARKKPTTAAAAKKAAPAEKKPKSQPRRALTSGARGKHDLVIVESPAKAKTINKYLGGNYVVLASYGHVRDLPRRRK